MGSTQQYFDDLRKVYLVLVHFIMTDNHMVTVTVVIDYDRWSMVVWLVTVVTPKV